MHFFFNDTATTEIYTLSLHDALPISPRSNRKRSHQANFRCSFSTPHVQSQHTVLGKARVVVQSDDLQARSEEHTSELQSRQYLVCRLLLEKKKIIPIHKFSHHSIPQS